MAEEFQAEVCGGSWWSSPFMPGNYGGCWQNDFMINMKTRSTDESSGGCSTTISPDSVFQMMGSPSSSTTTNWNQALLANGRTEESYIQTLPEILTNLPAAGDQNSSNFGDCSGNLVTTSYGYPSNLLQTLLENTSPPQPQQQPLYNDIQQNLNDFNPVSNNLSELSSLKPKQRIDKSPFWNTSMLDLNNNRASFFGSAQPRFLSSYEEKPNCRKSQDEEIRDLGSLAKKSSCEPTFKRPRLKTPSPLPTFKVRKEKLGDRVTALQQLVSPFGKTDTASVLHEAIEYIKLLHDQVNVLSAPYIKNGPMMQRQQIHENGKHAKEGAKQHDLRSRGLCLVPVSSTFPVATDAAPDYWSSSFGSTFK